MTGQTATPRHPNTLHAITTAWSYQQARAVLSVCAARETAKTLAEQLPAADFLRSPTWGTRHAAGGHGDPTGTISAYGDTTGRTGRETWWNDRQTRAEQRLTWIADQVAPSGGDPFRRIIDSIPTLQPGTAMAVTQHLADEEHWIREALQLPPNEQMVPGAECPACRIRPMYVRTAAPDPADWTVVCADRCRCVGDGCGCGILIRVEGAVHIWEQSLPTVAAPTGRTEGMAA